eukprot:tig00021537_g22282.t1
MGGEPLASQALEASALLKEVLRALGRDEDPARNTLIADLLASVRGLQPQVQNAIASTEAEDELAALLAANDELVQALRLFEAACKKYASATSVDSPQPSRVVRTVGGVGRQQGSGGADLLADIMALTPPPAAPARAAAAAAPVPVLAPPPRAGAPVARPSGGGSLLDLAGPPAAAPGGGGDLFSSLEETPFGPAVVSGAPPPAFFPAAPAPPSPPPRPPWTPSRRWAPPCSRRRCPRALRAGALDALAPMQPFPAAPAPSFSSSAGPSLAALASSPAPLAALAAAPPPPAAAAAAAADPVLPKEAGAALLQRTGLPTPTLAQIWDLCDKNRKGHLTRSEAILALRLASAAQRGAPLDEASAARASDVPPARLSGPSPAPVLPAPPLSMASGMLQPLGAPMMQPMQPMQTMPTMQAMQPMAPLQPLQPVYSSAAVPAVPPMSSVPAMSPASPQPLAALQAAGAGAVVALPTPEQAAFYASTFANLDSDRDGFLAGAQAREYLSRSGLALETLARVWALADVDRDGRLDADEFALAMHLIHHLMKGPGRELPPQLPPGLVPPRKRSLLALAP